MKQPISDALGYCQSILMKGRRKYELIFLIKIKSYSIQNCKFHILIKYIINEAQKSYKFEQLFNLELKYRRIKF